MNRGRRGYKLPLKSCVKAYIQLRACSSSFLTLNQLNLSNLLFEYQTILSLNMWTWGEKNQTQITFWEIQRENPDNSSQCKAGVLMSIFTELIVFIQVLPAHGSSPSTRLMPVPTTCPKPTPGEETVSTLACFRLFDTLPEFEMSERVVLNHDEVLAFFFYLILSTLTLQSR